MSILFSADFVSVVFGFVLSYLVERIPKIKDWWAATAYKEVYIALAGLIIVAALVGLYFAGAPITGIPVPFIWEGLLKSVSVWVGFVTASQGAYLLQSDSLGRKRLDG